MKISPNWLYKTKITIVKPVFLHSWLSNEGWLWHARLGHTNFDTITTVSKKELVTGLPQIMGSNQLCESCLVGKQTQKPFPKSSKYRANKTLELIHRDLCGPIFPPINIGNTYIFVLIDDYSHFMWYYLMKETSGVIKYFKKFMMMVENRTRNTMRLLRTDRGSEFTSHEFGNLCEDHGMIRHITDPYTYYKMVCRKMKPHPSRDDPKHVKSKASS